MVRHILWALIVCRLMTGCASPQVVAHRSGSETPRLDEGVAVMSDGYRLPLRVWSSSATPRIVLLGLHGFNDYSKAFAALGRDLARQGITTYAIDQRGFGASAQVGRWHGTQQLTDDLRTLVELVRARHPRARLFVAGESMGGAVAMLTSAQQPLPVEGMILIAPAVWSRDTMPWYQRLALQTAVHTMPWLTLTGEGVRLSPTDNLDLLRTMSTDPWVIKATRVDALWGIANLMDAARAFAPLLQRPVLWLYGEHDEIIPKPAFCSLIRTLPDDRTGLRLVLYRDGWHMLPRDRQGARVRADIAAWVRDPSGPLPSGEEVLPDAEGLRVFCDDR